MIKIRIHADDCTEEEDRHSEECECPETYREFANWEEVLKSGWSWDFCSGCQRDDPTSDGWYDEDVAEGEDDYVVNDPVCTTFADGEINGVYCTPACRDAHLAQMKLYKETRTRLEETARKAWPTLQEGFYSYIGWFDTSGHEFAACMKGTLGVGVGQTLVAEVFAPLDGGPVQINKFWGTWSGMAPEEPSPDWATDEWKVRVHDFVDSVKDGIKAALDEVQK